jgi:hypothetical protein
MQFPLSKTSVFCTNQAAVRYLTHKTQPRRTILANHIPPHGSKASGKQTMKSAKKWSHITPTDHTMNPYSAAKVAKSSDTSHQGSSAPFGYGEFDLPPRPPPEIIDIEDSKPLLKSLILRTQKMRTKTLLTKTARATKQAHLALQTMMTKMTTKRLPQHYPTQALSLLCSTIFTHHPNPLLSQQNPSCCCQSQGRALHTHWKSVQSHISASA